MKAIISKLASLALSFSVLGLLAGPMAANAALISYDVSGTSGAGWTLTGEVVLDDADLIAFTNLSPSFVSWTFSWTNGIDTLTNDSSLHVFAPSADVFVVDSVFAVYDVFLCTGTCTGVGAGWPEILISPTDWEASIPPEGNCCISEFGFPTATWTGPRSSVPVPATLALFGLGLAGLGWSRRKKA